MLVPIFETILPKTLLKWTTPQSKLATKFKSKNTTTTTAKATSVSRILTLLYSTAHKYNAATTKTTAAITNNLSNALSLSSLSLSPSSSSLSSSSSPLAFYNISILIVAKLFLHTVINNLSSLMNDFRIKLRYLTTATTTKTNTTSNSALFSNLASLSSATSSTTTATIDTKLVNNNYKNNHRTYNNSSKSNKVFLHYTPRDPRLRIFTQSQLQQQQQQPSLATLNKHLVSLESLSELKITEDLCNYGELIGGFSGESSNKTNKSGEWYECVLKKNSNSNCYTIVNCCDLPKLIVDDSENNNNKANRNNNKSSEKCDNSDKVGQSNYKEFSAELQQQQDNFIGEQYLEESSAQGYCTQQNCSVGIKGFFTAVLRF